MSKSGVIVLIVAAVVFLAVGFFVGQTASAVLNTPGSEDDPLVAQSYVESLVGERTAALQTQIDELKQMIEDITTVSATTTTDDSANETDNDSTGTTDNNSGTESNNTTTTYKTVEIISATVNVRAEPTTDSAKVASVYMGDKLDYIGAEGDWYNVRLSDGTEGWVASFLAKVY